MSLTDVDVLISFGGASGGFELAWSLFRDIQGKGLSAYLDAISLEKDEKTIYKWDNKLGIVKMSNPNWDKFYAKAMDNCKYMIFIITKHWLNSYYCIHEYNMFLKKEKEGRPKKPIFVVFEDAYTIISYNKNIKINRPKAEKNLSMPEKFELDFSNFFSKINNDNRFVVQSANPPGVIECIIDGEKHNYKYMYALNGSQTAQILKLLLPTVK